MIKKLLLSILMITFVSSPIFAVTNKICDLLDSASYNDNVVVSFIGPQGSFLGLSARVGDLDGDGVEDILIAAPITTRVPSSIYYIKGRGSWINNTLSLDTSANYNIRLKKTANAPTDFSDWGLGLDMALADVNGDGKDDLIYTDPVGASASFESGAPSGEVICLSGGAFWSTRSGDILTSSLSNYLGDFSWYRRIQGDTYMSVLGLFVTAKDVVGGDGKAEVLIGQIGPFGEEMSQLSSFGAGIYIEGSALASSAGDLKVSNIETLYPSKSKIIEINGHIVGYGGALGSQGGVPFVALNSFKLSSFSEGSGMPGAYITVTNKNNQGFAIKAPANSLWLGPVQTGDFDGDGYTDLFTTCVASPGVTGLSGVYVFFGPFTFGSGFTEYAISSMKYLKFSDANADFSGVKIADLNDDGKDDILAVAPLSVQIFLDLLSAVGLDFDDLFGGDDNVFSGDPSPSPTSSDRGGFTMPNLSSIEVSKIPLTHNRSQVFVLRGRDCTAIKAKGSETIDIGNPANYDYKIVGYGFFSMLGLLNGIDVGDVNGDGKKEIILGEMLGLSGMFRATGAGNSVSKRNAELIRKLNADPRTKKLLNYAVKKATGKRSGISAMGDDGGPSFSEVASMLPSLPGCVYVIKNPLLSSGGTGPTISNVLFDCRTAGSGPLSKQPTITALITAKTSGLPITSVQVKLDGKIISSQTFSSDLLAYNLLYKDESYEWAAGLHKVTILAQDSSNGTSSYEATPQVAADPTVVNLVIGNSVTTQDSGHATAGIISGNAVPMSYDLTSQVPLTILILDPRGFVIARKDIAAGEVGAQISQKNRVNVTLPSSVSAGPYYYMISDRGKELAKGKFIIVK